MLKTDAAGNAIGAVLIQNGQPTALVSHKFSDQELNWSKIEKEAFAIVRFVQERWRYLLGTHFTMLTDQKGVSYLFDSKGQSYFRNNKVCRWRLVSSDYEFDVQYLEGKLKVVAVLLYRNYSRSSVLHLQFLAIEEVC